MKPSCSYALLALCLLVAGTSASASRTLKDDIMPISAIANTSAPTSAEVVTEVQSLLGSLCQNVTIGINGSQAAEVAIGTADDLVGLVQGILCNGTSIRDGVNATSLVESVSDMLQSVNASSVSAVVQQLFANPSGALSTIVDMLRGIVPNIGGMIPVNGTTAGDGNSTKPTLDIAALQPILKAIQNDPEASQELPNLLPMFLALASGNTSALSSLNFTQLQPVLIAIWRDPQARATVPELLPFLESAVGSVVSDKTGSDTLGDIVSGLLSGLTQVANSTGLLDLIFGVAGSSNTTAAVTGAAPAAGRK